MGWKTATLLNLILLILLYFYMTNRQNALNDGRKKLTMKNCKPFAQGERVAHKRAFFLVSG
jgi:hypothetical protein